MQEQHDSARAILQSCKLLTEFDPSQVEILIQFLDVRQGQRGDVLFFESEQADALYIVAEGRVELLINDDDGYARVVGWLGPSESFGELSLIAETNRHLTVRATGPVTLYELNVPSFARLQQMHPEVCLQLIIAVVKRVGTVMSTSHDLMRRLLLRQLARV